MATLIDRYLDGELTEDEARRFEAELARDPELAAKLLAYEQALADLARAETGAPSPDFTARVMADVHAAAAHAARPDGVLPRPSRAPRRAFPAAAARRWPRGLALAASLAVVFGLGWLAARVGPGLLPEAAGPSRELAATGDAGARPGAMPAAYATYATGAPAGAVSAAALAAADLAGTGLRLVRLVYVPRSDEVGRVGVAGTFNGWDPARTPMEKADGVWTTLMLLPIDTYEYMFVEDGRTWRTDPLALQTRDDGFGRKNAVLDLSL